MYTRMYTRTQWIGWSLALAAATGVMGAALMPPFVDEPVRAMLMRAFGGLCHQLPDRSPHVYDVSMAVCDRCLGIYGGVVLGILAMPVVPRWTHRLHRYAGPVLAASLAPLAVDWLGPITGVWENVPLSRAVTGALFGLAAGLLVARTAMHARGQTRSVVASGDGGDGITT